ASAFVSLVNGHAQILNAQGLDGSPASVGFQVDSSIARNCTTISPCQQDATIIRDAEIDANIVNECGRTELSGNIDVGENTENALTAGTVTQVQSGSQITVTIHQVNADGAGPFICDLDETSNAGIISQNLTVTNNVPGVNGFSQAKAQDFDITVTMPDSFTCTGASTGDVCTVRCRNNAVAGPFGGCFAVQQVDTTPKVNTPANIDTLQSLDEVLAQVQQDQADLPAAIEANQNAGSEEALQNAAAVEALLQNAVVTKEFATTTPSVVLGGQATSTSTAAEEATSTTDPVDDGDDNNNNGNGNDNDGNDNNGNGNDDNDNNNDNNNNNGRNRNNNNNNKRRSNSVLRWARRMMQSS
ncbi:putative gas1-like protein, partial [Zalerion maritima]